LLDAAERDDAGGIHQSVEPAMLALDVGGNSLPIGFRGDVERRIGTGEIGGDRRAAGVLDRGGDGCADGTRGAGHQNNPVLKIGHRARRSLRTALSS